MKRSSQALVFFPARRQLVTIDTDADRVAGAGVVEVAVGDY